jgi:hypothetical protein
MAGKLGRAAAKKEPRPRASRKKVVTAKPEATDEQIKSLIAEGVDLDAEYQKALTGANSKKASYRAKLREIKKATGLSTETVTKYIGLSKRDPAEVTREFDELNRVMRLMGLPVGTQLGLFGDGESVATKVDNDKQADADELSALDQKAADDGYAAGEAGVPDTKNPYEEGAPRHELWATNWGKAQHAKLSTIGRGNGAKTEARAH